MDDPYRMKFMCDTLEISLYEIDHYNQSKIEKRKPNTKQFMINVRGILNYYFDNKRKLFTICADRCKFIIMS